MIGIGIQRKMFLRNKFFRSDIRVLGVGPLLRSGGPAELIWNKSPKQATCHTSILSLAFSKSLTLYYCH